MSALSEALSEYVATTRALGIQLRWPALSLRRFVDFLEREGAEFITSDLAVRWATEPVGVQAATWARRLSIVRRFAIWMHATDPRTQIPPQRLLPARHRRKPPYIFSDREIRDLMAAAALLPSPSGLRSLSYVTLIGLLSATGLRPGEAVALDDADVDLQNGVLRVCWTKFRKSRFVPVEESTRDALADYAKQRDELLPQREIAAFLVSEHGSRLSPLAARRTFAKLSGIVGLRPTAKRGRIGRGPRLQDLRHTFTTWKLIEWYRAGLDVGRMMPGLSTYLGHSHVQSTYWYIEAVPELLELATERLIAPHTAGVS